MANFEIIVNEETLKIEKNTRIPSTLALVGLSSWIQQYYQSAYKEGNGLVIFPRLDIVYNLEKISIGDVTDSTTTIVINDDYTNTSYGRLYQVKLNKELKDAY